LSCVSLERRVPTAFAMSPSLASTAFRAVGAPPPGAVSDVWPRRRAARRGPGWAPRGDGGSKTWPWFVAPDRLARWP
jgi:hypothetical protein